MYVHNNTVTVNSLSIHQVLIEPIALSGDDNYYGAINFDNSTVLLIAGKTIRSHAVRIR